MSLSFASPYRVSDSYKNKNKYRAPTSLRGPGNSKKALETRRGHGSTVFREWTARVISEAEKLEPPVIQHGELYGCQWRHPRKRIL